MSADPITIAGTFNPDQLDPMMAAIRQLIVDSGAPESALAEFGEAQVAVVPPEDTESGIAAKIAAGIAYSKGLCLLLVAGSGKNPDRNAPGPRMTIAIEAQLYVSTRIRGANARPVLELLGAVMKLLHHAQIRISGFPWYEELVVTGFDPVPDDDYTAYVINIEREFQL